MAAGWTGQVAEQGYRQDRTSGWTAQRRLVEWVAGGEQDWYVGWVWVGEEDGGDGWEGGRGGRTGRWAEHGGWADSAGQVGRWGCGGGELWEMVGEGAGIVVGQGD